MLFEKFPAVAHLQWMQICFIILLKIERIEKKVSVYCFIFRLITSFGINMFILLIFWFDFGYFKTEPNRNFLSKKRIFR